MVHDLLQSKQLQLKDSFPFFNQIEETLGLVHLLLQVISCLFFLLVLLGKNNKVNSLNFFMFHQIVSQSRYKIWITCWLTITQKRAKIIWLWWICIHFKYFQLLLADFVKLQLIAAAVFCFWQVNGMSNKFTQDIEKTQFSPNTS